MIKLSCRVCGSDEGDVRLVEHGIDQIALCKPSFFKIGETEDA